MRLGCIADDFTGATDLANALTRGGIACIQYNGLPPAESGAESETDAVPADAAVIALKTRSIPAAEAVAQSLAALDWLRRNGCSKIYFKYCSTFDSSERGNIGPVAEALMEALETDFTIACPAAPENGRSVYQGHLFVGDSLLAETGMRHHPLTPMTDSNLVRVLQRQSRGTVGLIDHAAVTGGPATIRARIEALRRDGCRLAIADAVADAELRDIVAATGDLPLITGGSGLATGLPALLGVQERAAAPVAPEVGPLAAVLAGSCSEATNRQVEDMRREHESYRLDPRALARGDDALDEALAWARARLGTAPILIYSTAPAEELAEIQSALGRERASHLVESAMGSLARGLVESGVRRLVVAGGETAGAVVSGLAIDRLAIGPEIAPGVPWTVGLGEPRIALALKSGNFGAPDFFTRAFEVLP